MKRAQHAAHNPKFEKMGPTHMVEGGHHLRKAPSPHPRQFQESINSYDTNYIFNDDKDLDQYDLYAIPSRIMPGYSYPASWWIKMKSLLSVNELIWHWLCP